MRNHEDSDNAENNQSITFGLRFWHLESHGKGLRNILQRKQLDSMCISDVAKYGISKQLKLIKILKYTSLNSHTSSQC